MESPNYTSMAPSKDHSVGLSRGMCVQTLICIARVQADELITKAEKVMLFSIEGVIKNCCSHI